MPYLELTLSCTETVESRYQSALEDVGALSVTLMDAHLDAPDEQAIFEPGVGETPLWQEITLTALFPADVIPEMVLMALDAFDPELDFSSASFRTVEDQDWERAWMDQFQPMQFGRRTYIVPWNHELPTDAQDADAAVVRLDPGLAFGTGTHATTALCLTWLDGLDLAGKRVLDFGCGSGILAIAALKLGAAAAVGIDNDPQALTASLDNAERNDVAERLFVYPPEDEPPGTYAVVVANILASTLDTLAPLLASRVESGGHIALSGVLHGQETELLKRYAEWFDNLQAHTLDEWVRIDGIRR